MSKSKVDEVLTIVKEMTVLELNELVKAFEEEFGVSAAAPVMVAGGPVAGGGDAAAAPEENQSLTSSWPLPVPARSRLSRWSARSPAWA